jgi:hypothetical protein
MIVVALVSPRGSCLGEIRQVDPATRHDLNREQE